LEKTEKIKQLEKKETLLLDEIQLKNKAIDQIKNQLTDMEVKLRLADSEKNKMNSNNEKIN
jgi:hypothetical protein